MITEETKRIILLADTADRKKRGIDESINQLQKKIDRDRAEQLRNEAKLTKTDEELEVSRTELIRKTVDKAKQIMDQEHHLAELRKRRADIDKKASEIRHWAAQSEYDDISKRQEAVSVATRTFNSI